MISFTLNHSLPVAFYESLAAEGTKPFYGRRDGAELFSSLKKSTSGRMEETRGVNLQFIQSDSLAQFQLFMLLMESAFSFFCD